MGSTHRSTSAPALQDSGFDLVEVIDRPVRTNAHSRRLTDLVHQAVQVWARRSQQTSVVTSSTDDVDEPLPDPVVATGVVLGNRTDGFKRCQQPRHRALGQSDVVRNVGDALRPDGQRAQHRKRTRDGLHSHHRTPRATQARLLTAILYRIVELFCSVEQIGAQVTDGDVSASYYRGRARDGVIHWGEG